MGCYHTDTGENIVNGNTVTNICLLCLYGDVLNVMQSLYGNGLESRIDDIEKKLSKMERFKEINNNGKKPYVCPRCNDLTDCDMCRNTGLVWG
jgi:hypothetical protein